MGTGSSGTDVAGYQGPNALPQDQFGPAPTGGMDPSAFPMTPAPMGPPGTTPSQSPIEPNTYRPANTMFPQTQSPINQPQMSPFNPATAPPLGGAPMPTETAPPTTDPFAVPARLPTPPGVFVSHQAGFDPGVTDQTLGQFPMAGLAMPSPAGGAPKPAMPNTSYGGATRGPTPISNGFSPTQGAPTLGMSPVMGALAASAGMGGAAQSGFAHGPAPTPPQMGAMNPATFAGLAGLSSRFTPQGGQFSGAAHGAPGMPLPIRKPILPPLLSPPPTVGGAPDKSGAASSAVTSQVQAAAAAKSAQAKIASQQAAMQSIGAMSAMNALSSLANSGGAMAGLYKDLNYGMNIGFGGSMGGGGSFGGL
jgi:hypothetical protein